MVILVTGNHRQEAAIKKGQISLRTQLLALQIVVVAAIMLISGALVAMFQERQFREAYRDRMIAVAQSVATLPTILDAYSSPNPSEIIQPIAEVIREASNVTYVVVTDADGVRYSHPNSERIGEKVSTDPSVPLSGEMYVGTQTGTLGESWRVKIPVFDDSGVVIGSVSVGILENDLQADLAGEMDTILITLAFTAVIGVVGATWLTGYIQRKIYGLEPDEIAALLETREAVLSGIKEGIIVVGTDEKILFINDASRQLLSLAPDEEVLNQSASQALDYGLYRLIAEDSSGETLVFAKQRLLIARQDQAVVDDKVIGKVLILRDHTEQHKIMAELEGAQSLAKGLRAQAHEFSNRLHVIAGLIELGETQQALSFIERTSNGGAISELISNELKINVEVAALILAKRAQAQELGVKLTLAPGSNLDFSVDSSERLELLSDVLTILGNLIDNAIDAVGIGGEIFVELDYADRITLEVSDNGPGVNQEISEQIYIEGFSTKNSPKVKAERGNQTADKKMSYRGIGLALVKSLVLKHNGAVNLSTAEAGGAKFKVHLLLDSQPNQNVRK